MRYLQLKLSLFLIFFISAILLNSVGIVILQSVTHYQVIEVQASIILEACKDLTIAIISFAICSFIRRLGYKNAMLTRLAIIATGCIAMATLDSFAKILFILIGVGVAFALIKFLYIQLLV